MGGYMMMFDGVDDEIMIPHLPTIITTQYTIEAWVRPAKVGPMNIVTRSDETYPMTAWSHQLRINAEGKFEHYLEADDKYTVSHTVPVNVGQWYHVAGVAVADGEMKLFVDGQVRPRACTALPCPMNAQGHAIAPVEADVAGLRPTACLSARPTAPIRFR